MIGKTDNSEQKWYKNLAANIARWTKISKGLSGIFEKIFGSSFQFLAPVFLTSSKTNQKAIAFNYNVLFWALEFNNKNNDDRYIILICNKPESVFSKTPKRYLIYHHKALKVASKTLLPVIKIGKDGKMERKQGHSIFLLSICLIKSFCGNT